MPQVLKQTQEKTGSDVNVITDCAVFPGSLVETATNIYPSWTELESYSIRSILLEYPMNESREPSGFYTILAANLPLFVSQEQLEQRAFYFQSRKTIS